MLQPAVLAVLVLLLGQFAIGMAVNLYVAIPTHHPGAHPANYFMSLLFALATLSYIVVLALEAQPARGLRS